jgi:small subunit ribosomal protein S7
MSRRRKPEKRTILPDPRFGDITLNKFMNNIMEDGKKSVAENIIYGALEIVEQKAKNIADDEGDAAQGSATGGNSSKGLRIFHRVLKKIRPQLEVRSRRVGGATYQVPTEVRPERAQALAMRWIIDAARKRSEHTMMERLAG